MQITYINGSPKAQNSSSSFLLQAMEERLSTATILWHHSIHIDRISLLEDISESQAILIAFPLYVDGIPSHLIDLMKSIECNKNFKNKPTVYVIVNCGFYEGEQNSLALSMLQIWAEKCDFQWGYGIGIGAGGMLQTAPIGKGSNTSIGKVFDVLTQDILKCKSKHNIFTNPDFLRFLYFRLGHMSWKKQAKANKLSVNSLMTQLEIR